MQLTIQTNTPSSLVALQGPQPAVDSVWMYLLLAGVFLGLTFYQRQWKLAVVPLGILLLGVVSYVGRLGKPSYQMSANFSTGTVHSETLARSGAVVSKQDTTLADVASAEMQYNRNATRIALILRNGEQRFPLGELHYNNEPDQYVILTKLREAIGQAAPVGK